MLDKNKFKKLMQELISIRKDEENLNKAFKKFEPDFNYISFGRYETLVVRALELAAKDESNWISYFLYDCDCGKNPLKVTDKNGKKYATKTLDDLWVLLNSNI